MLVNSVTLLALLICCAIAAFPGVSIRTTIIVALVATNLDIYTGLISPGSVGFANALKLGVIATMLWWKTRALPVPALPKTFKWLWLLFFGYVSLTLLWSEFLFAGIKQIGYLFAYVLVGVSLYRSAFHFGTRIYRWLLIAMFIALGLAVLQTWVLGNPFGVGEGRFTGFTASQTFGLFLGLLAPLLIANGQTARPAFAIPLVVAALIGAVMLFNGSRTGLLLLIFLSGFAFLGWFRSTGNTNRVVGFAAVAATLMVVSALSVGVMRHGPEKEAVSRATEGLLLVTGQRSYKDIGTLRWRLGMYAAIGLRQAQSSPLEWVVGHGMSDVADIVASGGYFLRGYDYDTVDANRIAHNEWLRSIYEFGIIGLSLLIALYAYILWLALRVARRIRTAETGVLLGLVFAIFVLLSTQNVFAASVAPHGFVITLVVARLLALSVQHELLTNVRGVLQQDRVHAVLDGQQPA